VIVPFAALVLALSPRLVGGRLSRFGAVRIRGAGVATAAFALQVAGLEVLTGPHALLVLLHVGSYVAAGVVLRVNRRVPGLWLVGLGGLSNGVTIALNGGTLPASPSALAAAGIPRQTGGFDNSGPVLGAVLPALGDVFAVPEGWPLSNVFSVGDLLIVSGIAWAAVRICGTRWSTPWDARRVGHAKGRHLAGVFGTGFGVAPDDGGPAARRPLLRHRGGAPALQVLRR
jgi:hypothetical protein